MVREERVCDGCGEVIHLVSRGADGHFTPAPNSGEWPLDRVVSLSYGVEHARADACASCFLKVAKMLGLDRRRNLGLKE